MLCCRYSLEDTCALLHDLGFHDASLFVQHSVTGSDLLDLTQAEMQNHLKLSPLQVCSSLVQNLFELQMTSGLSHVQCCILSAAEVQFHDSNILSKMTCDLFKCDAQGYRRFLPTQGQKPCMQCKACKGIQSQLHAFSSMTEVALSNLLSLQLPCRVISNDCQQ